MDKCPFCGAAPTGAGYACRTEVSDSDGKPIYRRSRTCYKAELTTQKDLIRRAEKIIIRLINWVECNYYLKSTGELITEAQALLPELEKAGRE